MYSGLTGYLVTITSKNENDFIYNSVVKNRGSSWGGATRAVFTDGTKINDESSISENIADYNFPLTDPAAANWYWIDGPEAGTEFYKGPKASSLGAGALNGQKIN